MRINYVCFRFLTSTGPCNKRLQRRWYLWAPSLCTCRTGTTCQKLQLNVHTCKMNAWLHFVIQAWCLPSAVLFYAISGTETFTVGFTTSVFCRMCNIMDFEKTNCYYNWHSEMCFKRPSYTMPSPHFILLPAHDWLRCFAGRSKPCNQWVCYFVHTCMHAHVFVGAVGK